MRSPKPDKNQRSPDRVLVVSYHFPPYGGGGVIRIHNFVKYLPGHGYLPTVLSASELYYESTYRSRELAEEVPPDTPVIRTRCLEPARWGLKDKAYGLGTASRGDRLFLSLGKRLVKPWIFPDRAVPWFLPARRAGRRLLRPGGFSLIFATSPPFTSALVAARLAARTKLPLVLDFRDDWVGNPLYSSSFPPKRALERYCEKMLLRASHKVICASEDSRRHFLNKHPEIGSHKYALIPNGFDPEYFENRESRPRRTDGKIRCVYAGSLTPQRTPVFFLRALAALARRRPDLAARFEVRFIGYIPEKVRREIEEEGRGMRVTLEGNRSPREIARILTDEADLCLVLQRRGEGGETAIPGKVYECLAAHKPILCLSEGGAVVRLLEELGSNLNCRYEDEEGILKLLVRVAENPAENQLPSRLGPETLARFNRKEQTGTLARIFTEASAGRS